MPRGGRREGAGRPLTAGEIRKQRQLRATNDEWELIQRFAKLIKYGDKGACKKFLDEQEDLQPVFFRTVAAQIQKKA